MIASSGAHASNKYGSGANIADVTNVTTTLTVTTSFNPRHDLSPSLRNSAVTNRNAVSGSIICIAVLRYCENAVPSLRNISNGCAIIKKNGFTGATSNRQTESPE